MNTVVRGLSNEIAKVVGVTTATVEEFLTSKFFDAVIAVQEYGDILVKYDNGDINWYEYDEFIEDMSRAYNDDKLAKQCKAIAIYPKAVQVTVDGETEYHTAYRIELAYMEIGEVTYKGHIEFKASVLDSYTTRQLMAFNNKVLDLLQEVR